MLYKYYHSMRRTFPLPPLRCRVLSTMSFRGKTEAITPLIENLMKVSSLQEFDAAEAIQSTEALAAYLRFAFETGSASQIRRALCTGARSKKLVALEAELREGRLSLQLTLIALEKLGMRLVPATIERTGA